jgi:hypothetical protein
MAVAEVTFALLPRAAGKPIQDEKRSMKTRPNITNILIIINPET